MTQFLSHFVCPIYLVSYHGFEIFLYLLFYYFHSSIQFLFSSKKIAARDGKCHENVILLFDHVSVPSNTCKPPTSLTFHN